MNQQRQAQTQCRLHTHTHQQCAAHWHAHANAEKKSQTNQIATSTQLHTYMNQYMMAQGVWSDVLHMDFICICICWCWRQEWKINIAKKQDKHKFQKKNPDHSHHCNLENKGELFMSARLTMHLEGNICSPGCAFFWEMVFFWRSTSPLCIGRCSSHAWSHQCWLVLVTVGCWCLDFVVALKTMLVQQLCICNAQLEAQLLQVVVHCTTIVGVS